MASAKVKQERDGPITVKIQIDRGGQTGQQSRSFTIHMDDPLRRIMLDFCDFFNLIYPLLRYTFDGLRIRESHTARDLGIEDGDVIDVFSEATGGYMLKK
ncbi:Putative small ubiquitin-related modifier 8 [Striga hermonthica]|uniref:Small ubiquitin-related modifier 8 n=1 Tax=Striga hermonthica TaxID=68872 RepID=A0A9N7MW04_STRHE|nr:Putative small ubiquitin-related modifier 8 [Striga hermonthica]